MDTVYSIINMLGMFICFTCCVIVIMEKISRNQIYLLLTSVCAFVTTVGDALEFFASTQEAAIVATKVAYLGKCYIMMFALLFVTGFTRTGMSKKLAGGMAVFNTILIGIIMCCDKHTLYYSSIDSIRTESGRVVLLLGRGPFYYAWAAEMMLSMLLYCIIAVKAMLKGSGQARLRMNLVFLGAVFPLFVLIVFMLGDFKYFDPMTLAVTVTEVCFLIAVKWFGLLDTMQLAQERVLEDTKDGLIVVDNRQENIIYANPVARTLLPELRTGTNNTVIERIFHAQENVYDQDGRHYEIRISELRNDADKRKNDLQGYIAWIFDMTFIDKYTSEMIRLKEESEQANVAKTNFLTHMSHEIRTPMNAIVGYSDLALRTEESAQVRDYLKRIKQSAHTLLHLINELLDISKIETGKMELVKVSYHFDRLMQELQSMMEAQAAKAGISLIMDIDEKIPNELSGDRVKLQEILINLISNSIKYTREGSVILRISAKEQTQRTVMLHIEVEDTGIGIREEDYSRVFGKFEQFDRKKNYHVEGSGLGLSIVKSFVEMMEGSISFQSEYGKGTVFIADVRQEICVNEESQRQEKEPEQILINKGHVLVVDDNELNCEVAKGILECFGISVDTVFSGEECLAKLNAGIRYDIIFMDHMMPNMDGVETLHEIRRLGGSFAQIPVALLTANAVFGVKEEMLKEGFDAFLTKPIDIEELQKVLLQFLGSPDE